DYAVYFQRGRDVQAIDPATGNTLWIRHGIDPGSEIFGDSEVIIIAPPSREAKAIAVRAADGQLLGECAVPPPEQRWTTFGRYLLASRTPNDGNPLLVMLDPWGKREVWSMRVANGMKGTIVDGESVAVMQPDGKFSLISLADGTRQIDQQLEAERNLQNI